MIQITGPSLSVAMFSAARYIQRGATCQSCKRQNRRWIITLTVKGY